MLNYNAWFSVALEYGLSILSIGKVGSNDEQLLTGGLTAVESLLGAEIGLTKKEGFVVDHGMSHMERIPLMCEDLNLYAQFLLQNINNDKVDDDYKELAKTFITEVTTNLMDSPILNDIKLSPQKIPINKINDLLIKSYEITHKKLKVRTNNIILIEVIKPTILSSFNSFSFSETLNHLSTMSNNDFFNYIKINESIVFRNYLLDIQNKIIDENPLIFLLTQPMFFRNELEGIIKKELSSCYEEETNSILNIIVEEIFRDNSLRSIIQKFDANDLRKDSGEINTIIEQLLKQRLINKSPLIFILNTDFNLSDFVNEKIIDRFLNEFDLGNVLSKISKNLILKAHPEDEMQANLVFNFFINLSQIFPGGLPKQLWIIIVNLMQIYASEAKVDILQINKIMEVEDVFWKIILENIKTYRVFNIIDYNLAESGTELMNLFDGVRETIGKSFHSFYTKFIWDFTTDSFGTYFNSLQTSIVTNYQAMQTVYYFVKFLNYLKTKKFAYFDPIQLGFNFKDFKKTIKPQITSSRAIAIHTMSELTLDNVLTYFIKKIDTTFENANGSQVHSEYETILKKIPEIIEKEKIKTLKLKIDDNGEVKSFDFNKMKNLIIKEEIKQFKGDAFLTDTDFLFTFCTTLLFDSLTIDMINKAIDLAIYNPKTSKIVKSVVEKGQPKKRDSESEFFFTENLKREIIDTGNTVLRQIISSTIHKEISKENYPLKTFIDKTEEVLAVKISELNNSFQKWVDEKKQIHPRINLFKEKGKINVYLEVGRRPNTGINEVQNLMDAIALQTYNNEMIRLGVFIESLKIVASTLGEYERNKVQNLFNSIGEFLITN